MSQLGWRRLFYMILNNTQMICTRHPVCRHHSQSCSIIHVRVPEYSVLEGRNQLTFRAIGETLPSLRNGNDSKGLTGETPWHSHSYAFSCLLVFAIHLCDKNKNEFHKSCLSLICIIALPVLATHN